MAIIISGAIAAKAPTTPVILPIAKSVYATRKKHETITRNTTKIAFKNLTNIISTNTKK